MEKIQSNIRKLRKVKSLSQAEFAKLVDCSRASIGAYEEGRATPKYDLLITIANTFSIPVNALIERDLSVNEILGFNKLQSNSQPTDLKTQLKKRVARMQDELSEIQQLLNELP